LTNRYRPILLPFYHDLFQKSILTLVAMCLLFGSGYLPLPIPVLKDLPLPIPVLKDLSIPFPCQNMGCGCQNARQCWADCCCHSDQQKIEWAKANNVKPPAWFVALSSDDMAKSKPAGSCCGSTCCSVTPASTPVAKC